MNHLQLARRATLTGLLLACTTPTVGVAAEPVLLVLSGGGARGAAHVGVLKALEEQHVPIDGIVGTSMGALVGGLYASGYSAAELERIVLDSDWTALFNDRVERSLESYRRKEDERTFAVRPRLQLDRLHPRLPLGAMNGRRVRDFLRRQTTAVAGIEDFSRLPIPFRAVAADLETGEAVVLERGDLVLALRASMAVPGVFTPVTLDGRHLVDGGIAENLAVAVARRDGPAHLIAVDIASPPLRFDELGSAAGVLNQAITLLMARDSVRQVASLGTEDVLIRPALGSMSGADFSRTAEAIRLGEEAGRAAAASLSRFALAPAPYAAWRAARRRPASGERTVTGVVVSGPENARTERLRRDLGRTTGRPLDAVALQRVAEQARASGRYDSVDLIVTPEGEDGARVRLELQPLEHGSDSLLFGVALLDDLEGGTGVDLGVRWMARDLAERDLESRVDLRLGRHQTARIELRQRLGASRPFFVAGTAGYREDPFGLPAGESLFLNLRRRDLFAGFDGGLELGRSGELRVGVEQRWSRLRRSSELGFAVGDLRFDEMVAHARLGVDTLDDATMPSRGWLARVEVDRVLTTDLAERGLVFGELVARRAWHWGATRLLAGVELADELTGDGAFPRVAAGGLFRLSGFAEEELRGSRLALAALRFARPVAGTAARNPVYLGASLELGAIAGRAQALSFDQSRPAGSLFVAVDSLLGPIYLYVGFAEKGARSWGFSLGRHPF